MTVQHILVRSQPSAGLPAAVADTADAVEVGTQKLFQRLLAADVAQHRRQVRAEIIELNLPFAARLAGRFLHRGQGRDDLTQVAALALVKAVDGFDPGKGQPFYGYAVPTIVGELKRHFRDKGWDVRVPRRLQERHLQLNQARAELTQRLQRAPTAAELGQVLNLSPEQVHEGLAAGAAYDADSLNHTLGDQDHSCERQDLLGHDDPGFEAVCDQLSLRTVVNRLPPRERHVVTRYFFGDATQVQIAGEIGMSQMNVSRILQRALAQLKLLLDREHGAALPGDDTTGLRITTYSTTGGVRVVAAHGRLDDMAAARLRDALVDTAVHQRPRAVVVDLRQARYATGCAVRALVDGYRACGHVGASFSVVNVADELYELLRRLGVTHLFACRPQARTVPRSTPRAEPVPAQRRNVEDAGAGRPVRRGAAAAARFSPVTRSPQSWWSSGAAPSRHSSITTAAGLAGMSYPQLHPSMGNASHMPVPVSGMPGPGRRRRCRTWAVSPCAATDRSPYRSGGATWHRPIPAHPSDWARGP